MSSTVLNLFGTYLYFILEVEYITVAGFPVGWECLFAKIQKNKNKKQKQELREIKEIWALGWEAGRTPNPNWIRQCFTVASPKNFHVLEIISTPCLTSMVRFCFEKFAGAVSIFLAFDRLTKDYIERL